MTAIAPAFVKGSPVRLLVPGVLTTGHAKPYFAAAGDLLFVGRLLPADEWAGNVPRYECVTQYGRTVRVSQHVLEPDAPAKAGAA